MSNRIPAEVFSPGEYIIEELEARGWTQQDLAQILGRPASSLSQVMNGKRPITPELARGLAAAFGTSAELWMNLESAYQLAQAETDEAEVTKRAKFFSVAPVNEMTKRGWLLPGDNESVEQQLCAFFDAADIDHIPAFGMAARKSTSYEETTVPQRAWARRVLNLAKDVQVGKFDRARLAEVLPSMRAGTQHVENLAKVPSFLAKLGIRLVVVAHLDKTRLDAATLWLNPQSPVVGLTLRFDRIDHFWFTLFHELVHVKNGDASIDSDLLRDAKGEGGNGAINDLERQTNAEAAQLLVPPEKLQSFIDRTRPLYAREKIIRFAQANSVHPGIVLGQLHHRDEIHPKNLRDLLVPVRTHILGKTITDGWGHQPGAF